MSPIRDSGGAPFSGDDQVEATIMPAILDELPDSMTVDTDDYAASSSLHERSRPTHPASDISALRRAVSAALASDGAVSQSRNSGPLLAKANTMKIPISILDQQMVARTDKPRRVSASSQDATTRTIDASRIQLPHHHPDASGTPWPGSPPLQPEHELGDDGAGVISNAVKRVSRAQLEDKSLSAADVAPAQALQNSSAGTPSLLPEHSPASLATSIVMEDSQAGSILPQPAPSDRQGNTGEPRWPSADQMSPDALRKYMAEMEIAKRRPRPRRKQLDQSMQLQRLQQELEKVLIRRAELLCSEKPTITPPVMCASLQLIARTAPAHTTSVRNAHSPDHDPTYGQSSPEAAQHSLHANSTFSSGTDQSFSKISNPYSTDVEEEILCLDEAVEALMVSISQLDKIKVPQIELSCTGPKTKNVQRAKADDDIWTDLTGRAPGIRRLSGFGTAYDTERTILTPAVSECTEVPTLSPMSSRSNLSLASTRSARSARSTRSAAGNLSAHRISIMQTLAEAEDSDQAIGQNTAYRADTDEGSQAVIAGSVASDRGSWQRDLENWASHSSPSFDEANQKAKDPADQTRLTPATSSGFKRREEGGRLLKERHLSLSSTTATANSTSSYLVRTPPTSPHLQPISDYDGTNDRPMMLSLHIPPASQRGTRRNPPSSKRTRQQHIVAGLQGDEWSGHRSLTAELQAATTMQQKSGSNAPSDRASEQTEPSRLNTFEPATEQSTAENESPAESARPSRTQSPVGVSTTIRIAAEALVSSVASVAEAVGIVSELHDTTPASEACDADKTRDSLEQPSSLAAGEAPSVPSVRVVLSDPDRVTCPDDSDNSVGLNPSAFRSSETQIHSLKTPSKKRVKRSRLTEAQIEEQRKKEEVRQAKEEEKVARWHQRRLAIDAKRNFQMKKDELHTKLANTRNADIRAEIQWNLGELYAAYAWGEVSDDPTGRDKPALGVGALTHALRAMYEALYAPSRRDKGAVSPVALDPERWARYAHLHMIMWNQTGGKTHLEWGLRAYNEAIKLSGDRTELSGNICITVAQFLQAQGGNTPELIKRAVTYWQRSTRCECLRDIHLAWRYVNLAHCYDVLTMISIAKPDKDLDHVVLRSLSIDAMEKAHSLDPTNASNAERLNFYQVSRDDEQGSLGDAEENFDEYERSLQSVHSLQACHRESEVQAPSEQAAQIDQTSADAPGLDGEDANNEEEQMPPAEFGVPDVPLVDDDCACAPESDLDSEATLAENPLHQNTHMGTMSLNQGVLSRHPASSDGSADMHSCQNDAQLLQQDHTVGQYQEDGHSCASPAHSSALTAPHMPDARCDGNAQAQEPSSNQIDSARDEGDKPCQQSSSRQNVYSAPPYHMHRQRIASEAARRASSASPHLPPGVERPHLEPQHLLHSLQQYHDAIQRTDNRLASVEADLRRSREDEVVNRFTGERHAQEQNFEIHRRLQQAEEAQMKYDDQLEAIRASLESMSARLNELEARKAGPEPALNASQRSEHVASFPATHNPRVEAHPSTSSPSARSRPSSTAFEASYRARSVPPMNAGRSSAAGRSDDPPPSFHSRPDDGYPRRSSHEVFTSQPYFAAGESFETFDTQAILERGAMLFGLYSLHQLARQTGLQTPLFPPPDVSRGT